MEEKELIKIFEKIVEDCNRVSEGTQYAQDLQVLSKARKALKKVKKNGVLHSVSESYIKCWNCKHFTTSGTNYANLDTGNCTLHECKVSNPKWQKCGDYEQCGNFR